MSDFYQVWLSAENKEEAELVLKGLTTKKLMVGGSLMPSPSHFWWKGKELSMPNYYYVMGFTTVDKRLAVENEYGKLSKEEMPMASFIKMEGNQKFLEYIYENIHAT